MLGVLRAARGRWLDLFAGLSANLQGTLWLLTSALLFTIMAVMIKLLGTRFDGIQVALFRALAGLMFTLPFLVRAGRSSLVTRQPALQFVRAIAAALAVIANFYAIIHLTLADVTALSFSRSLFLVPLAVFYLKEVVGWRRGLATITGFIGVLIVLRPAGSVEWAALVAVFSALMVAVAAVCVKVLSRTDSPATLLFYSGVVSTLMLVVPAGLVWQPPTALEWIWLIVMGGFGVAAQGAFIRAFSVGEATALAPIDYTRLIFAAVAGFVFFATVPDVWTWVGSAVIIGSTLYITRREAQLGKTAPPPPPIAPAESGFPDAAPNRTKDRAAPS